ncbi:hypothetical protein MHBO_003351, partial [Bonamia ostreae]
YTQPGEQTVHEEGFIRGHGTSLVNGKLISNISGYIERTNKLVSVRPINSRYIGNVGDVIVGRVLEVNDRGWKIDINGKFNATLLVNSLFVPGSFQDRKTVIDESQIRNIFKEGDLISAEIQKMHQNDSINLQTRSVKYGMLKNGCLVTVPHVQIRKMKSQFINPFDQINIVVGLNGRIWISISDPENGEERSKERFAELFEKVVRLKNCMEVLKTSSMAIFDKSITKVYEKSKQLNLSLNDILNDTNLKNLTDIQI